MAFVLVQHLDPSHHSLLADIISKTTRMPVEEVRSGMIIRPNCIYVIPPNALMAIGEGVFRLAPRGKDPGQHLTVNFFMRSLAEERKGQAIGIVLTLHKKLSQLKKSSFVLCGVGPQLMQLLKITRLDRILTIKPTQQDALETASR